MEKPLANELLDRVAQSQPIARKLSQIGTQRAPSKFSHVIPPARAFLSAIIARHVQKTVWILCPTVRTQDSLYETILNWLPNVQFLPQADFPPAESILPDPKFAPDEL